MFKTKIPENLTEKDVDIFAILRRFGSFHGMTAPQLEHKRILCSRGYGLLCVLDKTKEAIVITRDREFEMLNSPTDTRKKSWWTLPKEKCVDISYDGPTKLMKKHFKEGW